MFEVGEDEEDMVEQEIEGPAAVDECDVSHPSVRSPISSFRHSFIELLCHCSPPLFSHAHGRWCQCSPPRAPLPVLPTLAVG